MFKLPFPAKLLHAQMELDTARFYWQTVEQQTPQLIDGTYQRLFDDLRAGVDEEDEADLAVSVDHRFGKVKNEQRFAVS